MGRIDHKPYSEVQGEIITRDLIIEGKKQVRASSVVGYCHCDSHKGFVTKELYKKHKCAEKKCSFLEKFPDYPYWEAMEKAKRNKEKHRIAAKARKSLEEQRADALAVMAREAQLQCLIFGYAILITRIQGTEDGDYIINYVSDNLYNDWSRYFLLAYSLKQIYKKNFWLKHVKLPNGEYASSDDWKKINGGITMDITPIYELKSRLRAAAIAGTNLLSEDFRLKKAAENFAPLAGSSPVFAKINEMTGKLLTSGKPEDLLDTITLVDAVITTLATVGTSGALEPIEITETSSAIVNAPYSQLSPLLESLTTKGSGNYNTFLDIRDNHPELMRDYRVKPVLVKGLNASYSELAFEVEKTIAEMGRDMLPLLKQYFDPKGKKEAMRCINVIESIAGAEENDFYLEQLEESEKDVRKALIYALRHDEGNIDRLIELTKTEKGKPKEAALAALASFDSEKSAAFFEEYAKKKPVEVIKTMNQVSSEWSSELTAKLIDELLVDDKGNKITLSQSADVKNVKLKAKTGFYELNAALWGKWGESVEKIYREYEDKDKSPQMSARLGDSIIVTGNERLMALAIELNNKSKMKGHFDYAETVARLLGKEDSTDWFKKKAHELKLKSALDDKAVHNSFITRALRMVEFKDGKHVISVQHLDDTTERWEYINVPITQSIHALADILIKSGSEFYNTAMGKWINPDDRELCDKLGKYFVEQFMKNPNSIYLLNLIHKANVRNVKGLARAYFGNSSSITQWGMRNFFNQLPGDDDFKLAEAREIIELFRKGKLKAKFDVDDFSLWVESGMK